MSSGLVSFDRVMTVVKEPREPLDTGEYLPEKNIEGFIEFENIGFAYDDAPDVPVLKGITFSVKPGQVVALLGSTGSGKTTIANLLPRFYNYTEGTISIDGVELKRYSRKFLRSQIGTVEQEPFLFSRTIRENIIYGIDREVSQEEIEAGCKSGCCSRFDPNFPGEIQYTGWRERRNALGGSKTAGGNCPYYHEKPSYSHSG